MKRILLNSLPLLLLNGILAAQTVLRPADPLQHTVTFQATKKDSVYSLPNRFLFPGSVIIHADSLLVPPTQYRVETQRGQIQFKTIPDSGQSLQITYRALPVQLDPVFQHWQTALDTAAASDTLHLARVRKTSTSNAEEAAYGDELNRSGSIFRGITVGTNQGMRLESGLRLQVSGKITPDVEVVASLTDQNTPIQPEGNTQTLQEIDKVFVNVIAPHFKATLGDFVYESGGSAFGTYSRKLQGASVRAESSHGSATLMGAASKGNFATRHFNGGEGNQGPYQLTSDEGRQDIIVLAGTEKVYIDGEPMTRGEDNDYVIDYGLAQVTFTRNRLITGDSRITVDFEYSDQQFQKTLYGAQAEGRLLNEHVTIRSSFFREADDKDNPVEFALTDAYLSVLKAAGDNPDSAVVSGAKYVGPERGNYIFQDSIYVHVGDGLGDYTVQFSHVGYGNGDYSFQGYGIYKYEGTGKGTYRPVVLLPMARQNQMANVVSEIRLGRGIALTGEAAFSHQDLNQFSTLDDSNNGGTAFDGQLLVDKRPLRIHEKSWGQIGFETHLRHVGDQFRPVGRTTDIEYGRKWGMDEGQVWGEDSREFKLTYAPSSTLEFLGESGALKRGADFSSNRHQIQMRLNDAKLPRLNYRVEQIDSKSPTQPNGSWLRQNGSLSTTVWKFQPGLRYESENRKLAQSDSTNDGFRFDAWAGSLGFKSGPVGLRFEDEVRDDKQYTSGRLAPYSLARTNKAQFDFGSGSAFSSSVAYTHRTRDYADPATQDQISNLADAKIRFSTLRQAFDGSLNYQFSSTQVSEMVRDTLQVGAGFGSYRLDETLNELVPDPDGDLLIRMIQTGHFIPVNDLKAGVDFQLAANRFWSKPAGLKKILSSFRGRSRIRVERRDKVRSFSRVNRAVLDPKWGADSTMVTGLISTWNELEYTHPGGRLSVRLLFQKNDSEDHQLAQEGLIRHLDERGVRIKTNPTRALGFFGEYEFRSDEKQYENAIRDDRDIRLSTLTIEASVRPKQSVELALKTIIRKARDYFPTPATEASALSFLPRVNLAFRGRGNLRAEVELGKVTSKQPDRALPYEMLGGDQPGRTTRWNLLFTYRMSGHVQATLNWRGRNEPWRDGLYQTGQVEVRAFF